MRRLTSAGFFLALTTVLLIVSPLWASPGTVPTNQTIPVPTPVSFPTPIVTPITELISVSTDGVQANGASDRPSVSADGRFVVFRSYASNLVPDDTNDRPDIFIHDRLTNRTTRISVDRNGIEGNGDSGLPSISADGRYIVFTSYADNFVASDTNGFEDIFVHDRLARKTTRASIANDGSEGNHNSDQPTISAKGRYVAFRSSATNLVAGDTNRHSDIFVHDGFLDVTTRVSVASDGTEANSDSAWPSISADGRYVAFQSSATNLVIGDSPRDGGIFVHDRWTDVTTMVDVASDGRPGNHAGTRPFISADGRYVVFQSYATNLVADDTNQAGDVFLHDCLTGDTARMSIASDGTEAIFYEWMPWKYSGKSSISADGRYVAFFSDAANLAAGDFNGAPDAFVHDRETGLTARMSFAADGSPASSQEGMISADGRYVVFSSASSSLVSGDANGVMDIFLQEVAFQPIDHDFPIGSIVINQNATHTTETNVSISITGRDDQSGIRHFDLSTDGMNYSNQYGEFQALPYEFELEDLPPLSLPYGDGVKTIYLRLEDGFGNVSVFTDTIILDATAGTDYGISINNGAFFTNNPVVTLTLPAPALTTRMQVSNDGGFLDIPWSPYSLYGPWEITSLGNALIPRIVYARYKDVYGNMSPVYLDAIILDVTAPTSEIVALSAFRPSGSSTAVPIAVGWSGQDDVSGVKWYDVQVRAGQGNWADWLTQTTDTQATYQAQPGQLLDFRTRAQDNAGNWEVYPTNGSGIQVPGGDVSENGAFLPMIQR